MGTKAAFERKLLQTCDIYRKTVTTNASFERVGTEAKVGTGVPCFVAFPTGRKVVIPAGVDASKLRLFYFKADADVLERDRIVYRGRSYVVNYAELAGPTGHHLEAMCETVVGG